jgi:hypothetical protein
MAFIVILFKLHPSAINYIRKDLKPGKGLGARESCMPGTRQATLTKAVEWILCGSEPILWLSGIVGTGKSAVMSSLFEIFENHTKRLAAFIRFDRAQFSDASLFVRALACRLAVFDGRIGRAISQAIKERPHIMDHPNLSVQFNILILEPLEKLPELYGEGPIVILIDGLDECTNDKMRTQLINLLSASDTSFKHFAYLRIVVSGRPEEDIHEAFQDCTHIHRFRLDITSSETKADIAYFINKKLNESKSEEFRALCEGTEAVSKLSERASGLFIWAAVAVAFILKFPRQRLELVLKIDIPADALGALDTLYNTALESIMGNDLRKNTRSTLGAILVLSKMYHETLTIPILERLLAYFDVRYVKDILEKLRSIMITLDEDRGYVKLMHKSLDDFLTDEGRCEKDWYISAADHSYNMALACLSVVYAWLDAADHRDPPNDQSLIEFASWAVYYIIKESHTKPPISSDSLLYKQVEKLFSVYLLQWFQFVFSMAPITTLTIGTDIGVPLLVSLSSSTKLPCIFEYFDSTTVLFRRPSRFPTNCTHPLYNCIISGMQNGPKNYRSEYSKVYGRNDLASWPNTTYLDISNWSVI